MSAKSTLEKIKSVLTKVKLDEEIKLAEMELEDGTIIVAENFVEGESVFAINEEERIPLPVGEYTLADGSKLIVVEEGVIDSMVAAEQPMSDEELEAIEKKAEAVKQENEKLKKENDDMKAELSKRASKGIKQSPEGKINLARKLNLDEPSKTELANMPMVDRISYAMQKTSFYDNVKLSTTNSINTTYAGEFAGQYIAAATLQGVTLGSNAITIKPNIKTKEVVKKLTVSSILANASCDFTPTGTIALTERLLTPKELQVNIEVCKTDYKADWEAIKMGYSAFDVLPPNFQAFFAQKLAETINGSIESYIWHGVEATAGQFGGFVPAMTADGDVIDEAGTTVTAANVIDEIGSVIDEIPASIYQEPDLTIYVSPTVGRAYIRALGGFAATIGGAGVDNKGTQWYNRGQGLSFDGIPIFITNGLTTSYMVAAQRSNLWYGTGLLNDINEVKILDMADIDGSKNVRFVMRFTAGVQYGNSSEIVLYTP